MVILRVNLPVERYCAITILYLAPEVLLEVLESGSFGAFTAGSAATPLESGAL